MRVRSGGFVDEMARTKSRVDALILQRILPKESKVGEITLLYKMMRDYPGRPAKGLRPFMCVSTCRALGGNGDDALLTAACIELFQHWILIHDDIEDESELRRGAPSLHRKYTAPLALNAGDALHARMWGALLGNNELLGPGKTLEILAEFARMVNETTEGQHMELSWVRDRRWDLDESDYVEMCTRKTAWYTAASPCRLGGIVAGARPGTLEKLRLFGLKLGVAFQIQDDVLNLTADQRRYGKARSDDLLEGKRTLMLLRLFESAGSEEKARMTSIMRKDRAQKSSADVAYVLGLMEKYGTIEYASRRAMKSMKEALALLGGIKWNGDPGAVALLRLVARFAVERKW